MSTVLKEIKNNVLYFTLNRPDVMNAFNTEALMQDIAGNSEDYKEGVNSFLEKRKPKFKGK